MKKLLFVFGTRPEAIKLAPLILKFKQDKSFITKVCVTAQHRNMLDQVLDFFQITPDYDLNLMKPDQNLLHFISSAILSLEHVIDDYNPDLIFVQGDTSTVLCGALVAFHKKILIAHIEAGLRSYNKLSPFPEEINRKLLSHMADFHFAPTKIAVDNLKNEGITNGVYQVGNTVIDALNICLNKIKNDSKYYYRFFKNIDFSKRIILVTCHRRESFGKPFGQICDALIHLSKKYNDIEIVYPVHPNPNIQKIAKEKLSKHIKLISPLEYPYLVFLMECSHLILTDSGGIQEEAPSLHKPVLILRDVTERTEGIDIGAALLVGTKKNVIISETSKLLDDKNVYEKMSSVSNPYGDGKSTSRIMKIIKRRL